MKLKTQSLLISQGIKWRCLMTKQTHQLTLKTAHGISRCKYCHSQDIKPNDKISNAVICLQADITFSRHVNYSCNVQLLVKKIFFFLDFISLLCIFRKDYILKAFKKFKCWGQRSQVLAICFLQQVSLPFTHPDSSFCHQSEGASL